MNRENTMLAACFILFGCTPLGRNSIDHAAAEECEEPSAVCVRVKNDTNVDFDSFKVNFKGVVEEFGVVSAGQSTGYRRVERAHGIAYTEAFSGGERYVLQPIDFVGVPLLAPGKYTYRYRLGSHEDGMLVPLSELPIALGSILEVD